MNLEVTSIDNFRNNIFSENGEDGVIEQIFSGINLKSKLCCEFGAWDGIVASNCRNLIINHGWNAIMIEGNPERYKDLLNTYESNKTVRCLNNFVNTDNNNLNSLLTKDEQNNLAFLSIDIDGLDYEIFESLEFSPQVICIEVNTCHSPISTSITPRDIAKNNVGQPLTYFVNIANKKGYELVCFTGNAFFVRNDILKTIDLKSISAKDAYLQHLDRIPAHVREHLYIVNRGIKAPFYKYKNPYLTKKGLGLSNYTIIKIYIKLKFNNLKNVLTIFMNKIKFKLTHFSK